MSLYTASETNFYSSYLNQISMKKKKTFSKVFFKPAKNYEIGQ